MEKTPTTIMQAITHYLREARAGTATLDRNVWPWTSQHFGDEFATEVRAAREAAAQLHAGLLAIEERAAHANFVRIARTN